MPADRSVLFRLIQHQFAPGEALEYDIDYVSGDGNRLSRIWVDDIPLDLRCRDVDAYNPPGFATTCDIGFWNGESEVGNMFGLYHVRIEFADTTATIHITNPNGTIWSHTTTQLLSPHMVGIETRTGHNGIAHVDYDNFIITSAEPTSPTAAFWHFDESTGNIAHDETANKNDGTINGASWTTDCVSGNCLSFDDISEFVLVNDSNSLDLVNQGTLEAWIKTPGQRDGSIIFKGSNPRTLSEWSYFFGLDISGTRLRAAFSNGANVQDLFSNILLNDNTLHHVAVTWDGSDVKLYIDGNLDASAAQNIFPRTGSEPLQIGFITGQQGDPSLFGFWNGIIDEVRISNVALDPSEFLLNITQPPPIGDVEERLEALENLTASQQGQIDNLMQENEILRNQTESNTARISLLEVALDGLTETVNGILTSLGSFMDQTNEFLFNLPRGLRQQMVCGSLQQANLTGATGFGLSCEITNRGCNCTDL
ncbi:MAG: hypothetical protein HY518_05645 [Candidatus Aenigmarchaeota archaeon]|nr:hypothetical protein [Candidatus Aenigmarchaeota archaeon]